MNDEAIIELNEVFPESALDATEAETAESIALGANAGPLYVVPRPPIPGKTLWSITPW